MTSNNLRPIRALTLPADALRATDFGDNPGREWVSPTELFVDDEYQRDLNRKSIQLITKMVANFKWRKFNVPSCVRVGGKLHVIDGQHSAIAAATLNIAKIPIDVVDGDTALERADSFVSHNQDRLMMTPFDIHRALLTVGDPKARILEATLKASGARLIRVLSKIIEPKVGDTAALGVVRGLIHRRGKEESTKVLSAFVRAGRAPISAAEIAAGEMVLFGDDPIRAPALTAAAKALGDDGVVKCQSKAATNKVAVKFMLAEDYRKHARARG